MYIYIYKTRIEEGFNENMTIEPLRYICLYMYVFICM
jgi:hypothetical protein